MDTETATVTENLIEIEGVSKSYKSKTGEIQAIKQLEFNVKDGEFVSLLGPSGCGKSTLLMLVSGLISPTTGQIKVKGQVVNKPRMDVGIVFQKSLLLEWRTVLDNILLQSEIRKLPKEEYKKRAIELLKLVGLEGFENKYPRELSGGMQQRVAICRALVYDPQILLMDEPFGALDALTRERMGQDIEHIWLKYKKTVFLITHDIEEAVMLSDRVIVLSNRPCEIKEIIPIDFPRPRPWSIRETQKFGEYTHHIRDIFTEMGVLNRD
ncbi:MAG: ABC transporter ATP-binding protein [Tuberibacillus sp.]